LADADAYLRISGEWQIGSLLLSTATLALDLNRQLVRLRGMVPLAQENSRALEKQQADSLDNWLPDDAILMARFAGRPQDVASLLGPLWSGKLQEVFGAAGIDFRVEVLGNLRPGASASLSLAPSAVLSSMPVLDLRRTNPFRFVHPWALAPLRTRPRQTKFCAASLARHLSSVSSSRKKSWPLERCSSPLTHRGKALILV